jgi:hypothetical protein
MWKNTLSIKDVNVGDSLRLADSIRGHGVKHQLLEVLDVYKRDNSVVVKEGCQCNGEEGHNRDENGNFIWSLGYFDKIVSGDEMRPITKEEEDKAQELPDADDVREFFK